MLFSRMKATLKFLIERIESLFVDSITIELYLNDDKSEFTKVVVFQLSSCLTQPKLSDKISREQSKFGIGIVKINQVLEVKA